VLHPDRNYGNVDEATKLFAEIQSAYEVLADPQERAWYDSHSDAFLGTNGNTDDQHSYNVRITTAEDVLKLFSKFSPRMEFSDSSTGFFGGLREQFEQLALEERLACQWEDQDPIEYPSFGSSNDDFENVVRPFYAAWTGFSTQKKFAWKDVHRYSEAPDRRVRRMMEKENKRLREEGIREFNDAVRSLVAFVKKRDPRYKVNAQSEAQRQETLRQSVAAQAARSRAVNQAKMRDHVLPEWAQSEEPVAADEESEESEVESFECVVCHKYFKSQKQFEAHERSKKHLKAVKQLCWEMRMQNDELDLESADDSSTNATTTKPLEVDDGEDEVYATSQDDVRLDVLRSHDTDTEDQGSSHDLEETTKLSEPNSPTTSHIDDDDYASREYVETRLRTEMDSLSMGAGDSDIPAHPSSDLTEQSPTLKMGKAKQKRAKKAAKQADQPGFICAICQAPFSSKSKLFNHIRDLGHAQPVTGSVARKGKKH
jgi:DnaJ family protein A protein 5